MVIHITQDGIDSICDNEVVATDTIVTIEEALDPDGSHFNCVDCHKKLTGGRRHSEPS
jgi:hypothetical protein